MTEPRLDSPDTRIQQWELDEESSRFDHIRAWPSADTLQIKFSILGFVNFIVAASSLLLIASILRYKKTRENSFNLYVLVAAIPDFLASFCCMLTCWMSAPEGTYFSEAMCGFQSSYLTFAFTSNAWTNAVMVFQVHKLLKFSNSRRRYFPPTLREVCVHAAMIYGYALIWAMLAAFNFKGFPFESHAWYGYACFPMETANGGSALFYYLAFMPLILLIPTAYVFATAFHIYRYGLMPSSGKTRQISFFLMRIVFVYLVIWTPFLCLPLIQFFVNVSSWVQFTTSVTSHLQGLITAVVVFYTNPELRKSLRSLARCDCTTVDFEDPQPGEQGGNAAWWTVGRSSSKVGSRLSTSFRSGSVARSMDRGNNENPTSVEINPSNAMNNDYSLVGSTQQESQASAQENMDTTTSSAIVYPPTSSESGPHSLVNETATINC